MKALPEELLTRIFEELEPKDLLHVSRSSKKFARVAAPILYKRCEFAQRLYGRQRQGKKRLLRTLAAKPHFTKFVQHISLCLRCYGSGASGLYSYESILQDLVHHKDSLRTLRLHAMSCGHHIDQTGEPLGSLAPLKALNLLDVDEDNLVGWREPDGLTLVDVLPDNLEKIVFRILPMYSNAQLYKEVARALIKNETLQSIEMYHSGTDFTAELERANHAVEAMPEVVFNSDEWGMFLAHRL